MNSGTSQNDSDALKSRGWTLDSIKQQEAQLRSGCQPVEAVSTCEVGHGIFILTSEARTTAQVALKKSIEDGASWVRFVPASGAASRMFAGMLEPRESHTEEELKLRAQDFPFWSEKHRQKLIDMPALERPAQAAPLLIVIFFSMEEGFMRLNYW